jgi:hypothetical protein
VEVEDVGCGSGRSRCSDRCGWEGCSSTDNLGLAVGANVVVVVATGSVGIPLLVGIQLPVVARCSVSEAARCLCSCTAAAAVSTPLMASVYHESACGYVNVSWKASVGGHGSVSCGWKRWAEFGPLAVAVGGRTLLPRDAVVLSCSWSAC